MAWPNLAAAPITPNTADNTCTQAYQSCTCVRQSSKVHAMMALSMHSRKFKVTQHSSAWNDPVHLPKLCCGETSDSSTRNSQPHAKHTSLAACPADSHAVSAQKNANPESLKFLKLHINRQSMPGCHVGDQGPRCRLKQFSQPCCQPSHANHTEPTCEIHPPFPMPTFHSCTGVHACCAQECSGSE